MSTKNGLRRHLSGVLVILVLAASWPITALAAYDARAREAASELANKQVTDEERAVLAAALRSYFASRERCLRELLAILERLEESEQAPRFRSRAQTCADDASKLLSDALKPLDEPTLDALGFWAVFAAHEGAFMGGLAGLNAAATRDQIVVIRIRINKMTDDLDAKWREITSRDNSIDDRTRRIAEDIRKDMEEAIKHAAETNRTAVETLALAVRKVSESDVPAPSTGHPDIDQAIEVLRRSLGLAIRQWKATNTRAAARASEYRNQLASERRILVIFVNTRDDVRKFVAENGFPRAETAYGAARDSLEAFVGKARTSGQQTDAREFRDEVMKRLAAHLKDASDIYGDFVSKHELKFFGALGPSIKEELLETQAWNRHANWVTGFGLDSKLRDWQTKASNYFEVDLSRLSNDARNQLRNGLRGIVDELVREMQATARAKRELMNAIQSGRRDLSDALK